jgi:hypothetical protein
MEPFNNIIINIWNECGYMDEYKCKSTMTVGITTR